MNDTTPEWQTHLAAMVAETKPDDWDKCPIYAPQSFPEPAAVIRERTFAVGVESGAERLHNFLGSVNRDPIPGIPAGCALVNAFHCNRATGGMHMQVVVRDRPWNEFLTPDGTWRVLCYASGDLIFPEADFSVIR